MVNKIDSNVTGGFYCKEASLGTLPAAASQVWYTLEPNSWSAMGGKLNTVARLPINDTRQRTKGAVVDKDATAGFQTDVTQRNLQDLLQGFMFADADEAPRTKPLTGTAVTITSVASSDHSYNAASGLAVFKNNMLVKAKGFTNAANNGVMVVTTGNVAAKMIATGMAVTNEASPPAAAELIAVGYQFTTGDLALTVSGTHVILTSTALDTSTLGLATGQWVFVGDSSNAAYTFANTTAFYARVVSVDGTAKTITLDRPTATITADTGTGKTIRLFFGSTIANASVSTNIVTRSYTIERTLGNDGVGVQSEQVTGAVANEFTLNIDTAAKITADLSFVGISSTTRTGTQGPLTTQSGTTIVAALSEDAINTTSHVYAQRVSLVSATPAVTPLVGYGLSGKVVIKNNCKPTKAIGRLGAFDVAAGIFEVSGSLEAYFGDTTSVAAVQAYSDVAYDLILAKNNEGVIWDMPKVGLGNGQLQVTSNEAIKLPLDTDAFKSAEGYTFGVTFFEYLPTVAMPA